MDNKIYIIQKDTLTSIADAVREKTGSTAPISTSQFLNEIKSIETTNTSDATAIASDLAVGKTAYVNGQKIEGTLVFKTQYSGTTDPDNSIGIDGDIYIVKG